MPTLTIQLPNLPPVDHILREEMMTIGRMKGNTIALDDASVSVSHAKITRKGVEFFLKDLNSTNGTMLNGQSINEARLKDGDQVKFGEVIAIYRSEPEFISTTPGVVPAAAAAPSSQPTVAPTIQPATPPPAVAATAFVSKRLAVQAAQPAAPAPVAGLSSQTVRTVRSPKKQPAWQMPAAIGAVALVVGVVLWALFFKVGELAPKPAPVTNSPPAAAAAKNPSPASPVGNGTARPAAGPVNKTVAGGTDARSLADLKKALKAADPAERRKAAAKLREMGGGAKDALPELRAALNDSDSDVRMWVALALINNKSYDKATIPILIQVLQNDNTMLRQISCLSLALIPYEDADKDKVVAALSDTATKDEDEEVRRAAVSALKIIAPEAVAAGK